MASRLLSRLWYRSRLFWVLVLLLAYLAFGYLLLPRLVADALREAVRDHLGWQAAVGEVTFNPFDLALVVSDVVVSDEQNRKTLGFGALTVNVDTTAVFDRALGFELTELRRPYVLLEVLEGGTETNFGRAVRDAIRRQEATGPQDAAGPASAAGADLSDTGPVDSAADDEEVLPRLRFDQVQIVDAEIEVNDYSQGERVDHRLAPLNFSLLNFTTFHDKADDYQITIDLGQQQTLQWSGTINMVTRQSRGAIELEGLRLGNLQSYMKPYTGYRVTDGLLSMALDYDLAVEGGTLGLQVEQGKLGIAGLAVARAGVEGVEPPFLTLNRLDLAEILFDLRQREARATSLVLDGLVFRAHRDTDGQFRFLLPAAAAPLPTEVADAGSPATEVAGVSGSEADTGAEKSPGATANLQTDAAAITDMDAKAETDASATVETEARPTTEMEAVAETDSSGALASGNEVDPQAADLAVDRSDGGERPFHWALERFELNNGRVEWQDDTVGVSPPLPKAVAASADPAGADPAAVAPASDPVATAPAAESAAADSKVAESTAAVATAAVATAAVATASVTTAATVTIDDIQVLVSQISQDLTRALPFEVRLTVQDSGPTELRGSVVPAEGRVDLRVAVEKLALPLLQPYLDALAAVNLKTGTFSLQGDLQVDPRSASLGRFTGQTHIAGFELTDQEEDDRLVAWNDIGLSGLDVGLKPLSIAAGELLIDGPQAHLLIARDGRLNLAGLARKGQNESEVAGVENASPPMAPTPTAPPTPTASNPDGGSVAAGGPPPDGGPAIDLARLVIKDGNVSFRDLSYDPAVDIELAGFSGTITDLSSQKRARSQVSLAGQLDDYGKLSIEGEINPLSDPLFTDLRLALKNFDMTELSPYTGRFVGNTVEKGKMNLSLDYLIDKRHVRAENRVLLDQFTLGEAVVSEEATTLPVSLAIALMTDTSGRIDIDLPVEGNLDDPEFRIGSVVLTALGNLITKAATSPFALIEGLVGSEQGLDEVRFTAGSAILEAAQDDNLHQLATALQERPALRLAVRGVSNPRLDEMPLRQARLDKKIARQRKDMGGAADEEQVLVALADKLGLTQRLAALPDAGKDPVARQQALTLLLLEAVEVDLPALRKLADRRASAIRKQLVETGGLEADRVFVLDPVVEDQPDEAADVVVNLALEAS